VRDKISASVDLPLSQSAKRVFVNAADESERLQHRHIGTEHLLLGILREEKSLAAEILYERGVRLNQVRESLLTMEDSETETASGNNTYYYEKADTREAGKGVPDTSALFLIRDKFDLLLDLLVSKGVISEEEKRDITNSGG